MGRKGRCDLWGYGGGGRIFMGLVSSAEQGHHGQKTERHSFRRDGSGQRWWLLVSL